jgi:hypothetical protein
MTLTRTRRVALVISVLIALVAGRAYYNLFHPRVEELRGCGSPAVLAHRGFHAVAAENSIASVRAAVAKEFCGAEIDVQWFDDRGLIIAHDEVQEKDLLPNSLTLAQLLDSLPQQPRYLWLDFKNLDMRNAAAAAAHIDSLITRHNFANRFVVESVRSIPLRLLWWHVPAIIPAYWINRPPHRRKGPLFDAQIAAAVGLLGLPALSVPQEMVTNQLLSYFGHLSLFIWTCNTRAEMERARAAGARIILTDSDYASYFPPPGR